MSKHDKTIPNLENATPGFLVDEIGRIRVEAARLKFLEGVFKQALEARATEAQLSGSSLVKGEKCVGHFEKVTQERVDVQAVRDYFVNDPEALKGLMKVISFTQLKTSPRE